MVARASGDGAIDGSGLANSTFAAGPCLATLLAMPKEKSDYTTWKLARMNFAIRGIDANLGPRNADSFRADLHPDLKADFIFSILRTA